VRGGAEAQTRGRPSASRVYVHYCFPIFAPPPSVGGLDLNSSNRGCARLGSEVAPPLGVVIKEVAVLIAFVRRHRHASSLVTDLTRNTRAPHFTPQHWLLYHMGLY